MRKVEHKEKAAFARDSRTNGTELENEISGEKVLLKKKVKNNRETR